MKQPEAWREAWPVLAALLSHWRRHPFQLVTLLLGLALATALWSGVQALNAEARSAYASAAGLVADSGLERLESPSGQIALADFTQLRRAGWEVAPVIEARTILGNARVTVLGIDPLTPPADGTAAALAGADVAAFLGGQGFAHPQTLQEIGTTALELRASSAVPVGTVLMDIGRVQTLIDMPDGITRMTLADTQRADLPPLSVLVPDLLRIPAGDAAELAGLTDSFHLNLTAFGLLAFAVGLFIVHSAVGLAFEQRRAMFRTLRALGVPLQRLTLLLGLEMTLFAVIAGLAGLGLGYLVAATLLPDVAATLRGLYAAPVPGSLRFDPLWAAAGMGMTLAGTAVAGGQALWRLYQLPLLAPARPRAWAHASGIALRAQVVVAAALITVAGALVVFGSGLLAGFALLAASLVAAALLMPALLQALLTLAARHAKSPVAQWFWADSRQNLPRLSLALMALLLALAANIGVGTMVASFRATFIDWLDTRLVAELTVTPRDAAQADALYPLLQERADAVLPMQRVEARLNGHPGHVYAMTDHETFRENWQLLAALPDPWDRLAAGEGVLISEQLHHRAGLTPGETLALPGLGAVPVLGIYADYGNPLVQAVVTRDLFQSAWPDAPIRQFALRSTEPEALIARLQDDLGLSTAQITDQAAARAISLAIFERTFLITGALNVLTLSVAALALFAALATLSGMRLVQLAPLWALGLTPRDLAVLELARAGLLGGLTMLCALPVGLLLAQLLLAVINVQAFGWRLPLQMFPSDWAWLALWAGLAVLAASALPAARLWRHGAHDLLRVFSHDR